jgi:Na+/H+ antiporter NhaC
MIQPWSFKLMITIKKSILLLLLMLLVSAHVTASTETELKIPTTVFKGQVLNLKEIGDFDRIFVNGSELTGERLVFKQSGYYEIKIIKDGKAHEFEVYSLHGLLTVLPPIIAIILALIFKEVVISLFIGILVGALFINRFDFLAAFFNVIDKYIIEAVAERERASIVIFTLLLGGMVGIISKSGGVRGIVESLSRKVRSARGTQLYTWLMGILIFFDDYTNTLIVGNTMRPLTDKWKVSREKLSYIVDSTAAPMASIAIISTWIGFEISLINQSLRAYQVDYEAYHLFLSSLPYRFYPILALMFVFLIFFLKKDFGPMLKAEKRARKGKVLNDKAVPLADFESSGLNPAESAPCRWYNGIIPIMVVILFTFGGLYISGRSSLQAAGDPVFSGAVFRDLGTIVSSADSFKVLLWASMMGAFTAFFLAYFQKILNIREGVSALVQGMKSMMMAIVILVLAWSLGVVLVELHTADYLVSLLSARLDYHLLPGLVFVLSAFIAFSTGSSWGTIAIMYPLVIPIAIGLLRGAPDFRLFLVLSISSVLAGGVFGDHCSPISDTTIMSSMASSCDHIDHVKTQIPYALTAALVALFFGILPVSFGFPYLLSLALSITLATATLLLLGKKIPE